MEPKSSETLILKPYIAGMLHFLFIAAITFLFQLPLHAADQTFRHKPKQTKFRKLKDPVSRKTETLPKTFELQPTRRHILGRQHR